MQHLFRLFYGSFSRSERKNRIVFFQILNPFKLCPLTLIYTIQTLWNAEVTIPRPPRSLITRHPLQSCMSEDGGLGKIGSSFELLLLTAICAKKLCLQSSSQGYLFSTSLKRVTKREYLKNDMWTSHSTCIQFYYG